MKLVVKNRKASYEYEFISKEIAGIKLVGSEVKSLRNNEVSIAEAYCVFKDNELYIQGMHIAECKIGGKYFNHEPVRDRKLLLRRSELNKLYDKVRVKGYTIVPTALFLSEKGFFKLEIALAKGKKVYQKKQAIKDSDIKRDTEQIIKQTK